MWNRLKAKERRHVLLVKEKQIMCFSSCFHSKVINNLTGILNTKHAKNKKYKVNKNKQQTKDTQVTIQIQFDNKKLELQTVIRIYTECF